MEFTFMPWHWLVFGVLLLIAEVMGAAGFLLGMAIAALFQSVLVYLYPQWGWEFQLLLYGLISTVFTTLYWRFFRRFNDKTDVQNINDRAAQYAGRIFTLNADIDGEGKAQIGDTLWRVKTVDGSDYASGVRVKVVGSDGMILLIESLPE